MMRKLVILALLTTPVCQAAEPLGRLFFTPTERAELDRMRRLPAVAAPRPAAQIAAAPKPPPLPVPNFVTVNGIVQRSDGSSTVWINSKPIGDHDPASSVVKARHEDGRVTVLLPESHDLRLKVGQTVDVLSGEISEHYTKAASTPTRTPKNPVGEVEVRNERTDRNVIDPASQANEQIERHSSLGSSQ